MSSFEHIYEAHFEFVWRTLRRLGVRPADLPDATQDVFVVVHRRLPEFDGHAKVTTWLFRIAYRTARDRRRRAHVLHEHLDSTVVDTQLDEAPSASHRIELADDLALFDAALEPMPLEQRAVFTLFELEEQTGPEIAELLEVPLATVYSRLRLAREAFRRNVLRFSAAPRARAGGGRDDQRVDHTERSGAAREPNADAQAAAKLKVEQNP
ncbi:MAG TPA: sigma-70 family RNA polymerase sigma factor [Polyangiaceae bacterium]|nr:sigma-70 family RNA polymerase sigma factor [Polyangiaceae bacterium]